MNDKILKLKEIIDNSKKIVFFTGAGISTNSGIPDFRSANGLYNEKTKQNISPEEIISHSFFMTHPSDFYEFYFSKMVYKNAKPNLAHYFIASLDSSKDVSVITQNIDNLHTLAGSKKVIELHGSVKRNYCMKCHKYYDLDSLSTTSIPYCNCGGIIKPDVVLYEESLDETAINEAIKDLSKADTLIIIGTSLAVYPAASFIRFFRGTNLVLINKSKTSVDNIANFVIYDDVCKVLEELQKLSN